MCVKNFAFVKILCSEFDALSTVAQTNGLQFCGNRLNVRFKKGSKYEYLNEKLAGNNQQQSAAQNTTLAPPLGPSFSDNYPVI